MVAIYFCLLCGASWLLPCHPFCFLVVWLLFVFVCLLPFFSFLLDRSSACVLDYCAYCLLPAFRIRCFGTEAGNTFLAAGKMPFGNGKISFSKRKKSCPMKLLAEAKNIIAEAEKIPRKRKNTGSGNNTRSN